LDVPRLQQAGAVQSLNSSIIYKKDAANSQRPMDELSICTILSAFAIDTADPAESNLCDDLDD
jgi:hypothetical protein